MDESDNGVPFGLCITTVGALSIGIIITEEALNDKRYYIKVIKPIESKIFALEKKIHKVLYDSIPPLRLLNNVSIPTQFEEGPPSCYHYLIYDKICERAIGSSLSPVDTRFSLHANTVHDFLSKNPSVSQMILRDHKNGIYARKTFGREIFFQPTATSGHDLFMDHIERTVQKSLKNDHQQNLF